MQIPLIPSCGYQLARTGQNYAGILIGDNGYANYREYIQNKLRHPLIATQMYNIEFYLSKGVIPCTTNKIGIKFFNAKYYDMTTYWLTDLQPLMQKTMQLILSLIHWVGKSEYGIQGKWN
ncbi:MAG: hypothetical protein IPL10_07245 [Bacteroidetes bacterium]|nr:hypothetical protein [Bacteroidota bacterium]